VTFREGYIQAADGHPPGRSARGADTAPPSLNPYAGAVAPRCECRHLSCAANLPRCGASRESESSRSRACGTDGRKQRSPIPAEASETEVRRALFFRRQVKAKKPSGPAGPAAINAGCRILCPPQPLRWLGR